MKQIFKNINIKIILIERKEINIINKKCTGNPFFPGAPINPCKEIKIYLSSYVANKRKHMYQIIKYIIL